MHAAADAEPLSQTTAILREGSDWPLPPRSWKKGQMNGPFQEIDK